MPGPLRRRPDALDFLFEEADADSWRFRWQPSIARPLAEIGASTSRGIRFLRPEVALLYKAKHLRFKDQRDFEAAAPTSTPPGVRGS
ncbi:MAG TPA: hypothetical protein VGD37_15610 [Kofleriaceae bacterium]